MTKVMIMDGGMGRELKRMGAPFRRPEWSALALMEKPETVTQAHQSFVNAGAEIIISNTYAIVPFHIGQERFDEQGRALTKLAAKIARDVAKKNDGVTVAGSLPPAFGSYRPDLFEVDKAADIYVPLIEEQESYVDVWLAETMSSKAEVDFLIGLIRKYSEKPIWVSYSLLDRGEKNVADDAKPQLRSGEPVEMAIEQAKTFNIDAMFFNCSQVEEMSPALEIIERSDLTIPYGAYANAFVPIDKTKSVDSDETDLRDEMTPEAYFEFTKEWKDLGATIIGGCCGIGPEHILKLQNLNN